MRYRICRELKYKTVPCKEIPKGTPAEKLRAVLIKDNSSFGSWDMDMLGNEWDSEELEAWGVETPGFDDDIAGAGEDNYSIPDKIKTDIVIGDLFEIGEHRLLCGDSTNSDDVDRLIRGEKADMVLTDPPYGIKADKGFTGEGGFSDKPIPRRQYKDDWDTERPEKGAFYLILEHCKNAIIFGGNFFADLLPPSKHWLVWDKLNTMPTFGDCELAWTNIERNSVKKYTVEYNGLIGKEKERFHPTQKPVKLFVEILSAYTNKGDLILDTFIGSGTTMVAAHQLKRKCYGMELSPEYCQVIIDRMLKLDPALTIKRNGIDVTEQFVYSGITMEI